MLKNNKKRQLYIIIIYLASFDLEKNPVWYKWQRLVFIYNFCELVITFAFEILLVNFFNYEDFYHKSVIGYLFIIRF